MKRFLPLGLIGIIAVLIAKALFFQSTIPTQAVVSGGAGTITLTPQSVQVAIGQEQSIDLMINTNGTAISGIAMRLTIPVTSNDAQITAVDGNTGLAGAGWSFPITTYSTENGTTTIDFMAINSTVPGYSVSSDTKIGTIKLKANSAFTSKTLTFDTGMTKMLKKSDGSDMVSAPTNGSYSTAGVGSATPTPTGTQPTATPTLTQGNTKPTCTGLTVHPVGGTGVPFTATITCTGTDSNGTVAGAEFVFGDRTSQVVDKNVGSSGSITINHTYREVGSLRVTCRVRDNNNSYSDATDACNKILTIKPGVAAAPTTATPTPITGATITPEETPIAYDTPLPEPTDTEPVIEEPSSFPWWLVGVVVGLIVMVAGFILMRKQRGDPPPSGGQPYAPQPTYTPQPVAPSTAPPAAQNSTPPPYIPAAQAPPQTIPPAQTGTPTWPQNQ